MWRIRSARRSRSGLRGGASSSMGRCERCETLRRRNSRRGAGPSSDRYLSAMYEYISGPVAESAPAYAVIDAGGVGYYLHISLETFAAIEHAREARLFVHHVVREDAELLYGFATKAERELFRLLIGVSGVGGNTARMILSTYAPAELQRIIAAGDAVSLKQVKGLGLKTAQKIIVELSGKLTAQDTEAGGAAASGSEAVEEALAALVMLGFARSAAEKTVRSIARQTPSVSAEEMVRKALKML